MRREPDADSMTPEERLQSIARVLAKGLLRLQARSALTPTIASEDSSAIPPIRLEAVPGKLLNVTAR